MRTREEIEERAKVSLFIPLGIEPNSQIARQWIEGLIQMQDLLTKEEGKK